MTLLKSIVKRAKRDGYIFNDPFEFLPTQKDNLRSDKFWEKKEVSQFLLCNIRDELYTLYFVAIHTGMRLGELCGLKWDRVCFQGNQITISRIRDKQGLGDTTKTNSKRVIPMVPSVKELLLNLMKQQLNITFVFALGNGKEIPYGHIYRKFKKAQKRANIENEIRFHDLRHTFASQYMINGGSVFELQKIMGHTSIKMTMRYAHFSPEHLQSSIKYMDMGVDFSGLAPYTPHKESVEKLSSLVSIS